MKVMVSVGRVSASSSTFEIKLNLVADWQHASAHRSAVMHAHFFSMPQQCKVFSISLVLGSIAYFARAAV